MDQQIVGGGALNLRWWKVNSGTRILIVDDDERIRTVLSLILREHGYIVETAKDGKEAIAKSNARFFSLVVIDVRLPDIEGIKLLSMLRETFPKTRKIVITGYPTLRNAIESLNRGADAYLLKPLDIEELLRTISEQLTRQEQDLTYDRQRVTEFIRSHKKELEKRQATTSEQGR